MKLIQNTSNGVLKYTIPTSHIREFLKQYKIDSSIFLQDLKVLFKGKREALAYKIYNEIYSTDEENLKREAKEEEKEIEQYRELNIQISNEDILLKNFKYLIKNFPYKKYFVKYLKEVQEEILNISQTYHLEKDNINILKIYYTKHQDGIPFHIEEIIHPLFLKEGFTNIDLKEFLFPSQSKEKKSILNKIKNILKKKK